jgi:cyclopropane fatty-acyl-phospholipid synthase-like methyltransferase
MSGWENIYAAGEQLNRHPYSEIVSFVKRRWRGAAPKGATALDVGCGSGVHSALLAAEGANVTAFDASPSAIKHAQKLHGDPRITYQISRFTEFDPQSSRFDMSIDRLASTYATVDVVAAFYQDLRSSLNPDAQIFWQGFDPENTGRELGHYDDDAGLWTGFSSGVFQPDDTITFFTEADLDQIFDGYNVTSKRIISDTNLETGYRHSYWHLELSHSPRQG